MTATCPLTNRVCQCAPQAVEEKLRPCSLAKRGVKFMRLAMDTEFEGEAISSFLAMRRLFVAEKVPSNFIGMAIENCDLARVYEERKYTDSDMLNAINKGKEIAGREAGNQQQNAALEFFDGDGEPRWYNIALFCRDNVGRLRKDNEKGFVNDMPGKILAYGGVTDPQAKWLLSIFVKLGGRCDPNIQARFFQR